MTEEDAIIGKYLAKTAREYLNGSRCKKRPIFKFYKELYGRPCVVGMYNGRSLRVFEYHIRGSRISPNSKWVAAIWNYIEETSLADAYLVPSYKDIDLLDEKSIIKDVKSFIRRLR